MKALIRSTVFFCAATTLFAAGCAKQELVKKDSMIPAAKAVTAPKATAPVQAETAPAKVVAEAPVQDQAVKEAPAATADAKTLDAQLQKIYFDFDSSALSTAARDTLSKNAELLKNNAAAKARIEGNCDEIGSDDYNLALGERRAKAAEKYLVTLGIPAERLTTISYGKEKPAVPGHDEASRAKDRRDEFVIISQ